MPSNRFYLLWLAVRLLVAHSCFCLCTLSQMPQMLYAAAGLVHQHSRLRLFRLPQLSTQVLRLITLQTQVRN